MKLFSTLILSLGLSLMSLATLAHHSTNGIYNEEVEVELTGTVTKWRFINPHPSLILEVVAENGEKNLWDISYGGPAVSHLTKRGYANDTFKPGDVIKVRGFASKADGTHGLLIRGNPSTLDGTEIPKQ